MDLKLIKSIVEVMKRADLTEFEIEEEGFKLRIQRNPGESSNAFHPDSANINLLRQATPTVPDVNPPPSPSPNFSHPPAAIKSETVPVANGLFIKSPMVGTFYRSPSPESPPFVQPGDRIGENSVVCIIEAMKVMNEIQSDVTGVIEEVLVASGKSVEFGQPLFRLRAE